LDEITSLMDQVIRSIWSTTMDLAPGRVPGDPEPRWTEPPLTASVDITGDWQGTVMITCQEALVRRFSGILFGLDPVKLELKDLEDSLAELVNIAGGNLKSCLGATCRLSLPLTGRGSGMGTVQDERTKRLSFICEGYPFLVTIMSVEK
jgi:chemotaxis protein CheX